MDEYLQVLAFAALPAIGNFAGGLLSEAFRVSQKTLSLALHIAAGIVLAVVGIELMPKALEAGPA
jgi:ZIP family zinc transporter